MPTHARPSAGPVNTMCALLLAFILSVATSCPEDETRVISVRGSYAAGQLFADAAMLYNGYQSGSSGGEAGFLVKSTGYAGADVSTYSGSELRELGLDFMSQELPFGKQPDSGGTQSFPYAATALVPTYNISDVPADSPRLILSPELLYQIWTCELQQWDDSELLRINPKLVGLLPSAAFEVISPPANTTQMALLREMLLSAGYTLPDELPSCGDQGVDTARPEGGYITLQWLPDAVTAGSAVALLQNACDPLSSGCLGRSADAAAAGFSASTEWPMMGLFWMLVQQLDCSACLWRWLLASSSAAALLPAQNFAGLPRSTAARAVEQLDAGGWCTTTNIAGTASPGAATLLWPLSTVYATSSEPNAEIKVQPAVTASCAEPLQDAEHFRVCSHGAPPAGFQAAPLWLSGFAVIANLSGVDGLQLDASSLAGILSGDVVSWEDVRPAGQAALAEGSAAVNVVLHRDDIAELRSVMQEGFLGDDRSISWDRLCNSAPRVTCVSSHAMVLDAVGRTPNTLAVVPLSAAVPAGLITADLRSRSDAAYVAPSRQNIEACLMSAGTAGPALVQLHRTAAGCYPLASAASLLYRQGAPESPEQSALGRFVQWLLSSGVAERVMSAPGMAHLCSHQAWAMSGSDAATACGLATCAQQPAEPEPEPEPCSETPFPWPLWPLVLVPVAACLFGVFIPLPFLFLLRARRRVAAEAELVKVTWSSSAGNSAAGTAASEEPGRGSNAASRIWEQVKEPLTKRLTRVNLLDEVGRFTQELEGSSSGSESGEEDEPSAIDLTAPIVKVVSLLQRITNKVPVRVCEAEALLEILEQTDDVHRAPNMGRALDRYNDGNNQIAEYLLSMTDSGTAAPSSQDTQLKRRLSRTRSTKFSQLISGAADIESGSSSRREGLASQGSWGGSTLGAPLVDEDVDGFPQGSKEGLQNLPAPWLKEGVYTQRLLEVLEPVGKDYFCNVLCLQQMTDERPLTTVAFYVLHTSGTIQRLRLNVERLQCYLMAIEDGYVMENQYHNMYHAADVLQRLICVLRNTDLLNFMGTGTSMRFLTAVIAAAVHDFNHPGTNNGFVVRNQGIIAKQFNDQHVIENHSIRMALNMVQEASMNFLAGSAIGTENDWITFRHQVTTLVLSTDMSLHFESLSKFQTQLVNKMDKSCLADVMSNEKSVEMAVQMALKVADIGHCAMRLGSHCYWVGKLELEFFQQGDLERKAGFDISPLMDREKPGTTHPGNQVGFFDVIVTPLYTAFASAFPGAGPLQEQLELNYRFWKHCSGKGADHTPPVLDNLHWRIMDNFSMSGSLVETNEQYAYLTDMPLDGTLRRLLSHTSSSKASVERWKNAKASTSLQSISFQSQNSSEGSRHGGRALLPRNRKASLDVKARAKRSSSTLPPILSTELSNRDMDTAVPREDSMRVPPPPEPPKEG